MDLVRKKDNRTGIIISVGIHLSLLLLVFLSKGCVELQNPPQFTLEEVVVLDFSEKGGGSPGSSSPQQPQPAVKDPAPQEVTQEESPVVTPTSSNTQNATSEETTAEPGRNSPKTILVTYLDKALEAVKEVMDKVKVLELGQEVDQILVVVWVMEKEGRL